MSKLRTGPDKANSSWIIFGIPILIAIFTHPAMLLFLIPCGFVMGWIIGIASEYIWDSNFSTSENFSDYVFD